MTIRNLHRSGFVQRYHSNPDLAWTGQTNGQHQWGVAVLLLQLFPDTSMAALREALLHDTGEMGAADVSAPAKRRHPLMGEAAAVAERLERRALGVPEAVLTITERDRIKLCDMLEAYLFVSVRAPWVLQGDGWPKDRAWLLQQAAALGVTADVREALGE